MSSNIAISSIDSKLIGEFEGEDIESLEVEAKIAAPEAGLSSEAIEVIKAKVKIGRFIASSTSGFLVGDTFNDQENLSTLMQSLMGDFQKQGIVLADKLAVVDAIAKLATVRTANRAILLKNAEINAQRGKKKTRQDNAPQRINGGINFLGPTQINGKPSGVVPEPAPG